MNGKQLRVESLEADDVPEVVSVLREAFFDYPVMRFVLGDATDYDARLETLITFFTQARVLRDDTLIGIREEGQLRAVGLVSYPGQRESPAKLSDLREETWARLGSHARARYDTFGAVASALVVEAPHLHLNMIGVRRRVQGQGYGRVLLGAVHELSASDMQSVGVTLTTEKAENVSLYTHFGYELLGSADVAGAFTTWAMYRRKV